MRRTALLAAVLCLLGLLAGCVPEKPLLQETVRYDRDGNAVGRTVYTYDGQGNRTACTHYDTDGKVVGTDNFVFADGRCVEYTCVVQEQTLFSVKAKEGNSLQLTTDNKIRESTPEGLTARFISYTEAGLQFCETFDELGLRVKYERFNAAGAPYITYSADGERHYVEVSQQGEVLRLVEWDAYETERVRVVYDLQNGNELLREVCDMYGVCTSRVEYGYSGDALLYRAELTVNAEEIKGVVLYNAAGKKVLECALSEKNENGGFTLRLPDPAASGENGRLFVVTEYTAYGKLGKKTQYDVVADKFVK